MLLGVFCLCFISLFGESYSACSSCSHISGHKQTYSSTNDHLENPGRGFVYQRVVKASDFHPMDGNELDRTRQKTGLTMIWRTYVLDTFKKQAISSDFLNKIKHDISTLHSAGMTVVLRFCYTFTFTHKSPYGDTDEKHVLEHIQQLKPIFHQFEGVITSVEAGFIGTWGEWFYTDYFGNANWRNHAQDPYFGYTPDNWKARKDVLFALLDAVPQSIQVQVRYPAIKLMVYNNPHPVTYADVDKATKSNVARTAHHNDCFLSSDNDVGTYHNDHDERPYLAKDTEYLIVGGETCAVTKDNRDHCSNAVKEMERFHWTWLNAGFDKDMYKIWEQEGCYEEVHRRLGYRLRLVESQIQNNVQSGSDVCFSLTLTNDGFASPVKEMDVSLVLHQKSGDKYYRHVITDTDVRTYQPGQHKTISGSVHIPSSMPPGQYETYLAIGDKILKSESDYYVLLANGGGVPQYSKGLNDLKQTVTVNHSSHSSHSSCPVMTSWNPPKHSRHNRLFKAPSSGYATIIG